MGRGRRPPLGTSEENLEVEDCPIVEEVPANRRTRLQARGRRYVDARDLLQALHQIETRTRPGSIDENAAVYGIAEAAIAGVISSGHPDPVRQAAAEMQGALKLVRGKLSTGPDYEPPYMSNRDIIAAVKKAIARAEKSGLA